jgi:hypothetical protein
MRPGRFCAYSSGCSRLEPTAQADLLEAIVIDSENTRGKRMPKGTIMLTSYGAHLGTMSFELTSIYASGGPDFPILTIRTEVGLSPYIDRRSPDKPVPYVVSLVRAVGKLHSPEHRLVARFEEDLVHVASDPLHISTTQALFEIPLDLPTVNKIERDRAGGNLRVCLTIRLLLALHSESGAFRGFYAGQVDGLTFEIPRSQWVDNILPGLGYGGLELLEVRCGIGVLARELPKSVQEIREAKKYLSEGDWDKAVGHCRKAVEVILDARPASLAPGAKFRERVTAFIGDNLNALEDAQAKLLSRQMELIWEVSSQAAHPSTSCPFKRADAEFLVRSTMALVEYFSRLLS